MSEIDGPGDPTRCEPTQIEATRNETKRFSRSYDVQLLVERLSAAAVGELISYEEIDRLIGGHHGNGRFAGRVQSARRIVQHEKQYVFGVVRGEGLMRMNDVAIIKGGADSIAKIRRESVRGAKKLACVEYEKLDQASRQKHDAAASHLAVLAECARPATTKAITKAVEVENKKLTFEATLAAFRGQK